MNRRRWAFLNGPGSGGERKPFRMEKKADSADIYIYDIVGDSWDGVTAKQFAADLKALGDVKVLNVFINSVGGSVMDGVAIYNQLKRHRAEIRVQVDGLAASIASVIAMAGDSIVMSKNALMMIHDPWGFAVGTAEEMRKAADALDKMKTTIVDTYVARTGQKQSDVTAWMTAETWFTADEAVENGFADSVSDVEVGVAAMAGHDIKNFRNVPASLKSAIGRAAAPPPEKETVSTVETEGTAPAPHPALARVASVLSNRQWLGQPTT
jgi:ATP-dependent Clp endopeptidase proteolytic subunit ClpP